MATALGFATAYFFDAENGAARRKRLHQSAQRALRAVDEALAPDVEDPPVLRPLLRAPRTAGFARHTEERTAAVR